MGVKTRVRPLFSLSVIVSLQLRVGPCSVLHGSVLHSYVTWEQENITPLLEMFVKLPATGEHKRQNPAVVAPVTPYALSRAAPIRLHLLPLVVRAVRLGHLRTFSTK